MWKIVIEFLQVFIFGLGSNKKTKVNPSKDLSNKCIEASSNPLLRIYDVIDSDGIEVCPDYNRYMYKYNALDVEHKSIQMRDYPKNNKRIHKCIKYRHGSVTKVSNLEDYQLYNILLKPSEPYQKDAKIGYCISYDWNGDKEDRSYYGKREFKKFYTGRVRLQSRMTSDEVICCRQVILFPTKEDAENFKDSDLEPVKIDIGYGDKAFKIQYRDSYWNLITEYMVKDYVIKGLESIHAWYVHYDESEFKDKSLLKSLIDEQEQKKNKYLKRISEVREWARSLRY